jgi:hypothetical protein
MNTFDSVLSERVRRIHASIDSYLTPMFCAMEFDMSARVLRRFRRPDKDYRIRRNDSHATILRSHSPFTRSSGQGKRHCSIDPSRNHNTQVVFQRYRMCHSYDTACATVKCAASSNGVPGSLSAALNRNRPINKTRGSPQYKT